MNKGTIAFLTVGGTAVIVALVCAIASVMAWTSLRETTEERNTAIARGNALIADKEHLTADLQSTQGELTAQQRQNNELRDTNDGLQENIAGLESTIESLEDDVSGLEVLKGGLERTVAGLETANADLAINLSDARDRNADFEDANRELQTDLTDARAENASLETRYEMLKDDLEAVNSDLEDLQEASGTVDQLLAQAESIQGEIMDLEDKLRPLTIGWESRIETESFCTGSMAPTFTCLDSYTAITEFDPSILVEGAIISFDPNCSETESNGIYTRHRAIDIKVEEGVYYFWPKGDGNRVSDGCWVHQDAVGSYVVEVSYNSWPENAELWDAVRTAKEAYERVSAYYEDLYSRYCGFSSFEDRTCYLDDREYDEVDRMWDILQDAIETDNCWYDVARRSEGAGHIPEHTCTDPIPA